MAAKKSFKLDEGLEFLVQVLGNTEGLNKASKAGITNNLRDQASGIYNALIRNGIPTSIDPTQLRTQAPHVVEYLLQSGSGELAQTLSSRIDSATLKDAKEFYLGAMDDHVKSSFYTEVFGKLDARSFAKPDDKADDKTKANYKSLMKLKERLDTVEALEEALLRKDYDGALGLVSDHMGVDTQNILSLYKGTGAITSEARIYTTIASNLKNEVSSTLKGTKSYGAIEAAIAKEAGTPDSKINGYLLQGLYQSYKLQERINEAKKKEEAAKKKA